MKWEKVKELNDKNFRRITGVKRKTFEKMIEIVSEAERKNKALGGRPNKLSIENRTLVTLEYYREYRTYAQIGVSYGISESAAYKTAMFVEKALVESGIFTLPGKKVLKNSDGKIKAVLVDVTETPIERPKKKQKKHYSGKKKDTQKKLKLLPSEPMRGSRE